MYISLLNFKHCSYSFAYKTKLLIGNDAPAERAYQFKQKRNS